ncbi:molybdopterin-dependent oxidoreductase [Paenibacillus thermotolerans]|uniref:molybdopterin-dependent oxidoreductase n=1 Tax=Paenibacillus thermotolerans TaxID=3027807 RepID=UPI002367F668|nr:MULTISPECIES: molybdopterin-dependent oxidoreductase [unclassified Paenibacillus]
MKERLARLTRGYGKKLAALHSWNGWIVALLAATGLMLAGANWRELLGEGRVWIKWLHIAVGLLSIVPVIWYLFLAGKHWKQLRNRPLQRFNVLVVLALLLGWFASGAVLWQHRAAGPPLAGAALAVHDLLTWIGLPYIVFHSLTRLKWLKEPRRRAVAAEPQEPPLHPAAGHRPLYERRAFMRWLIGAGLTLAVGPSLLKWLGSAFGVSGSAEALERLVQNDANRLAPAPSPLPESLPPAGGGARGSFRIYTVTKIPAFTNDSWSFAVDGLVERRLQWDWPQFLELKRSVQVSDFHCVTGWSVYDNTWEGIPLKQLLELAGVKPNARNVKFYSGDGVYTDSLTLEQASMNDAMIAVMHDGRQIPSDLGGPVRLIVPKMYAYKSVKWLTRIELIEEDHIGYWEERGYPLDAWV